MIQIILAHDSFTQLGGAERVFLEMAEMFPEAPIYTLVADPRILAHLPASIRSRMEVTKLQWLYQIYPKFQHLLPFIPFVLWFTRLPECDVLLSSSSAFAKGFRKPKRPEPSSAPIGMGTSSPGGRRGSERAVHINYCHTPTRFLWTDSEYIVQEVPWIVRLPARIFLWWMKQWDLRAAKNVDVFLANSTEVQQRVRRFYNRSSEVVYPFVDTKFWTQKASGKWKVESGKEDKEGPGTPPLEEGQGEVIVKNDDASKVSMTPSQLRQGFVGHASSPSGGGGQDKYFLIAGRLHAHKHNDLVVEVCTELGLPLHVVGSGRDEAHLKSVAGPTVSFLGRVTDEKLREEFQGARAYIYPQLEDFGLMPVEAASCGTPTIGLSQGGSRETIAPGVTGEWFSKGNKEELKALLEHFDESKYSVEALRKHAEQFGKEQFVKQIMEHVTRNM